MPTDEHLAKRATVVRCAVITISDTRTVETDASGKLIRELVERAGHGVVHSEIVPDDSSRIRECVVNFCAQQNCDVVLLTGGTGIAPRDVTYEAVVELLEKRLDGFGELFRMLSYQEIGAAAMLSRAVAGIRSKTAIFCMPGSVAAVRLAMEKLILPQLGHLVALLRA